MDLSLVCSCYNRQISVPGEYKSITGHNIFSELWCVCVCVVDVFKRGEVSCCS